MNTFFIIFIRFFLCTSDFVRTSHQSVHIYWKKIGKTVQLNRKNVYINKFKQQIKNEIQRLNIDVVQSTSVENTMEMTCTFQHFQQIVVLFSFFDRVMMNTRESRFTITVKSGLLCAESAIFMRFFVLNIVRQNRSFLDVFSRIRTDGIRRLFL